jgi:chorismate-pyruvate lyase
MLRMLLAQDGSATRLLEQLVGASTFVHVIDQYVTAKLPAHLEGELPGKRFLRRITSLASGPRVLLDSISYIALDVLPASVGQELEEGIRPIGHVLAPLWTRRTFRHRDDSMLEELWSAVGAPDPQSSRSLCIYTPRNPILLLAETYRRGALS